MAALSAKRNSQIAAATATSAGLVDTTTQTFAGVKTFNSPPLLGQGLYTARETVTFAPSGNQGLIDFTSGQSRLENDSFYLCTIAIVENNLHRALCSFWVNSVQIGVTAVTVLSNLSVGTSAVGTPTIITSGGFSYIRANITTNYTNDSAVLTITRYPGY